MRSKVAPLSDEAGVSEGGLAVLVRCDYVHSKPVGLQFGEQPAVRLPALPAAQTMHN